MFVFQWGIPQKYCACYRKLLMLVKRYLSLFLACSLPFTATALQFMQATL